MQNLIDAAILGLIEGITEFIPVSSTGHLIIGEAFLKRATHSAGVFDVFIQIGAILAVVWVKRQRVLNLAKGFCSSSYERTMGLKIILAFLPAAIIGVIFHNEIKDVLFNPLVVGISLIVGGIILLVVEKCSPAPRYNDMDAISFKTSLGIGLCQVASLIPGVSRAGASIVGAQYLGVERKAATEFSFFLAIPTIFGAALFDLYQNRNALVADDIPVFAVGTLAAFISAFIVVKGLIEFVGRYGFTPFGYYRIFCGMALLLFIHFKII